MLHEQGRYTRIHLWVCQELIDDPTPAGVPGQGVVKLRGNLPKAVEPGVGDLGEIMVLIVVAHVVSQCIQGTIVRISLLTLHAKAIFSGESLLAGTSGKCNRENRES